MSLNNTNPNQLDRKSYLLERLKTGEIERDEAEELKTMLEKEKMKASSEGDVALVLGIAVLLGFVLKYLSDEKIIDFDKITGYFTGKK
jgi:hypothetical protein